MKIYKKDVSQRTESQIRNEVELQNKAYSYLKCTPKIVKTDYKTYIDMEDLDEMCVADMYGEDIKKIPDYILEQMYEIVLKLYLHCGIEYIDITPYNFIEKSRKVYIIDFGDAKLVQDRNWFLQELLLHKKIHEWNPDFR
jgi:tRNA A-37 threonylcarbamoyl transferase component Bud32